ncbi:MAG: relaxase/mobilization nuclease domain-containing protein [Eggerthellaceae bacterium]|nr:relaxase/mobilization nuclease domain-containing protein [Eggerthellaceae bacterium]
MPIVKTHSYHEGGRYASCKERREYLEKDCRHIYRDTINVARPDSWDLELDLSRKIYALHGNRTYKEYVLSPKDTDNATVELVRSFAFEWASTNFPEYEVVIVLHDDNRGRIQRGEEGIPHAHVIVNMIDLVTERKLRMPMERVRELHNSAQRIAERMGISRLEDYERGVWKESHREYRFSPREHQMKLRGIDTWKAVMKDMAIQAKGHSKSLGEFQRCLRMADIDLQVRKERIYLVDRDNRDRAIRADRLDRSLSAKELSRAFEHSLNVDLGRNARIREKRLSAELKREIELNRKDSANEDRRRAFFAEMRKDRAKPKRTKERAPKRPQRRQASFAERGKALPKNSRERTKSTMRREPEGLHVEREPRHEGFKHEK